MRELDKYNVLKEKLQGICDENNLSYTIKNRSYPFLMTIKPLGGMDAQQTMLEGMDTGETGYISPDATLVFAYRDGVLNYKISETFTISDTLFTKIKNLCKKLHDMWMMHFFRDIIECGGARSSDTPADAQDAENCEAEDDAFADFMDEADPAVEDEETEE
mgnify:CR=1 FL=1